MANEINEIDLTIDTKLSTIRLNANDLRIIDVSNGTVEEAELADIVGSKIIVYTVGSDNLDVILD